MIKANKTGVSLSGSYREVLDDLMKIAHAILNCMGDIYDFKKSEIIDDIMQAVDKGIKMTDEKDEVKKPTADDVSELVKSIIEKAKNAGAKVEIVVMKGDEDEHIDSDGALN